VDFVAVFGIQTWGIPLTELGIFIFGLFSWAIVFLLREQDTAPEMTDTEPEIQTSPMLDEAEPARKGLAQEITKESLEESRYD
jgi:hypothetical protein